MEELFRKLKVLKNISSTNDKKRFIKANEDDLLFKTTLKFLLDPYVITNISKKKIEKKVKVEADEEIVNMYDLYNYLSHNCTGKDTQIASVQAFINEHKEFEGELKEIVTKTYKLGAAGKVVNSALGYDLIPMFGCMLGESYFKNENKVKGKFILTQKLDGSRILILKENGRVKCFSRQGQQIENLNDIVEDVQRMNFNDGVIDGELLAIGEFKDSAEGYKETMKRSRIKGDKTGLKVVAYDFIADINNFYKGRDNTQCYIRKMNLENLIRNSKTKFVEYLNPIYYGTDKEVIQEKLREAIENNQEGLMLNLFDAPYECKRSKGLLKIKQFKDADVLVVGVVEGEGSMKGMTGALKCQFLYKSEVCDVEVGTGLKEEERMKIFNDPSLVVGKVITIKMFEVSKNSKTGKYSLRFPSFQGLDYVRLDKSGIENTNVDD